ncbi:MAG: zinc-dependent peptidase [Chitinophagales bacterium]
MMLFFQSYPTSLDFNEISSGEGLFFFLIPSILFLIGFFAIYLKPVLRARFKTKFFAKTNLLDIHNTLSVLFPYYKDLAHNLKNKFARRVQIMLEEKEFIGRNRLELNPQICMLVAASITQLTFGHRQRKLTLFSRILLYPDSYYSEIRKTYHKGEVNTKMKLIVLSITHLLDGIKDPDDGINLALHELSHAFAFEVLHHNRSQDYNVFVQWEKLAEREIQKVKSGENTFLRKYGGTNIHEMFAVCTENFFERPEEFQERLPQLYQKMMLVFKQNPANHKFPLLDS